MAVGLHFNEVQLFGDDSLKYLALVDLWGVTEKLAKIKQGGDLLDIGDLAQIQTRFWSLLGTVASQHPGIEVVSASDAAYFVADDPLELVKVIKDFLPNLSVMTGRFQLIPVRAAICSGLRRFVVGPAIQKVSNFKFLPYIGEAFVKTYKMEKFGPKGMRVFCSESIRSALSGHPAIAQTPCGVVSVKYETPENFYEVNWVDQQVMNHSIGLPGGVGSTTVKSEIEKIAGTWKRHGNRYQVEVADSMNDMLDWAQTGNYRLPPTRKSPWWKRLLSCGS